MAQVTGGSAVGVAPVPTAGIVIAGTDSGGLVRIARVDANGALSFTESSTPTSLVAAAPATVAVTTDAQILAGAATRAGLVIVNIGSKNVYLGLGATAVVNSGITLMAGGGTWVMDDRTFYTGAIRAIADTGGSTLSLQQFTSA